LEAQNPSEHYIFSFLQHLILYSIHLNSTYYVFLSQVLAVIFTVRAKFQH
jgi:hypothetical protein